MMWVIFYVVDFQGPLTDRDQLNQHEDLVMDK